MPAAFIWGLLALVFGLPVLFNVPWPLLIITFVLVGALFFAADSFNDPKCKAGRFFAKHEWLHVLTNLFLLVLTIAIIIPLAFLFMAGDSPLYPYFN